jgi:hypothetical protein
MTPCASRWSVLNLQVKWFSFKNYNCVDKGCLDGGALQDARAAHVFSAASCCKGFDVFPGLWPSVPCVCSLMDLVTALDMLHTT